MVINKIVVKTLPSQRLGTFWVAEQMLVTAISGQKWLQQWRSGQDAGAGVGATVAAGTDGAAGIRGNH